MNTVGFSGSKHERIEVVLGDGTTRSLVLKRVRPHHDWTAFRTGDAVGREAMLLATEELGAVWDVFHRPYVAFAIGDGEAALLMDDLSPYLLAPDKPMTTDQEERYLEALATLHARFWTADLSGLDWLAAPESKFSILCAREAPKELDRRPGHPLFSMVCRGWEIALDRLEAHLADFLLSPPADIAAVFADLPQTVLHGDAKLANFAFMPDGRLAAFDWATTGTGVCTLDLGLSLAVNAGRFTRSKEEVIGRYRAWLEAGLGFALPERVWTRMESAAVVGGAFMLLWSKALALEAMSPGAEEEWRWWVGQLRECKAVE